MNEQAVSFSSGDAALSGLLSIPALAKAIVVFAHGSGSNSRSTRNADTARMLYDAGFASLRADLLTVDEAALNERTGQYRFDVKLLSELEADADRSNVELAKAIGLSPAATFNRIRRLKESGEMPADGFDYHVAFHSESQLLVSEVWDSREQFEAFGQRVMPLLADVALEHSGQPQILEVHNIIKR